ncbi:CBS domain-containing protein [Oceanidesulfovibrio marinus]|uniref:CBS domain-containing protein n=1 Tax=Oceanidesulfovibrio marinus TaxID=370038 RepID=A0A6P1ZIB9_9BACT|nr:CBS domain-containing protein [Oceanidesulfovibrio marinus]QJT08197.1 CBS domain-containing protein [Oceanidesulfovibrio marinus]TVM35092.1 hypothetical protein DQK91_06750 [Oceanidesulfovibrio marinus]
MLTAKDIMTTDVVSVEPSSDTAEAVRLMLDNHYNGLPVIDSEGRLEGIICQSDLVAKQKQVRLPSFFTILDSMIPLSDPSSLERELQKVASSTVDGVMTRKVVTVTPDTPLDQVANLMVDKKLHTIPVVDAGKLVGVIGKEDVLRTLMDRIDPAS